MCYQSLGKPPEESVFWSFFTNFHLPEIMVLSFLALCVGGGGGGGVGTTDEEQTSLALWCL